MNKRVNTIFKIFKKINYYHRRSENVGGMNTTYVYWNAVKTFNFRIYEILKRKNVFRFGKGHSWYRQADFLGRHLEYISRDICEIF